jgi:hypothetical protein
VVLGEKGEISGGFEGFGRWGVKEERHESTAVQNFAGVRGCCPYWAFRLLGWECSKVTGWAGHAVRYLIAKSSGVVRFWTRELRAVIKPVRAFLPNQRGEGRRDPKNWQLFFITPFDRINTI